MKCNKGFQNVPKSWMVHRYLKITMCIHTLLHYNYAKAVN